MIRKELEVGNHIVTCVYDDTEYKIIYNRPNDIIAILNAKTGNIVKVFGSRLGFIEQVETKNKSYFVVSDFNLNKKTNEFPYSLDIYRLAKPSCEDHYLFDKKSYEINDSCYEFVHVIPGTYFVEHKSLGGRLLTIDGFKLSRYFDRVFNIYDRDEKFSEEDTYYVEETFNSHVPEISDRVIYGINPVTLKIKTGIYSFNQDRIIPLYTDEEISKAYDYLKSPFFDDYHLLLRNSDDERGTGSLNLAILVPLLRRGNRSINIDKYVDDSIKPDFVKKLGKYPINNNED